MPWAVPGPSKNNCRRYQRLSAKSAANAFDFSACSDLLFRHRRQQRFDGNEIRRIFSCIARGAISRVLALGAGFEQSCEREISQGIRAAVVPDFVDGFVGGE